MHLKQEACIRILKSPWVDFYLFISCYPDYSFIFFIHSNKSFFNEDLEHEVHAYSTWVTLHLFSYLLMADRTREATQETMEMVLSESLSQ